MQSGIEVLFCTRYEAKDMNLKKDTIVECILSQLDSYTKTSGLVEHGLLFELLDISSPMTK